MRISDWSSDVCSSDLRYRQCGRGIDPLHRHGEKGRRQGKGRLTRRRRPPQARHIVHSRFSERCPMPVYHAPIKDTLFLLNEVLGIEQYADLPGFANATPDLVEAVLSEAGKFCEEVLFPLNYSGDQQGCTRHEDGSVTTPKGFKEAYKAYCAAGWTLLTQPEEFGGQALPHVVGFPVEEYRMAANQAFAMYPGLTQAAVAAILVKGSDAQKATYVPRMVSGEWGGTMNLTEPHCGTDLGLIRTRAAPNGDGSYAVTGTKIFISSGEHDLTDNIIHLVLAKTPDAPDSVKGISLFVVPKFLVNADGSLGARNTLSCGSIEHKMGIHANATCVMNYDGATGWLVGDENKGLAAMFVMMNAERLGVGIQGLRSEEHTSELQSLMRISYAVFCLKKKKKKK